MPPIIPIVAGAVLAGMGVAGVAELTLLGALGLTELGAIMTGTMLVVSGVSSMINKRKPSTMSSISLDSQRRTITVRQPTAPHRIVYGRVGRLGGTLSQVKGDEPCHWF
jgi:hypothetical protein